MQEYNQAYTDFRSDVFELIPSKVKMVLDIGCSSGNLGKTIKDRYSAFVEGVEINKDAALEAKSKLDKVSNCSVEEYLNIKNNQKYDCIILADVFEHLIDPWQVAKELRSLLTENGILITSIPNIKRFETFYRVFIDGAWPFYESGIYDNTHIRFFTEKNVRQLFKEAGYSIENWKTKYFLFDKKIQLNLFWKIFIKTVKNMSWFKQYKAYQFLLVLKKAS